MIHHILSSSVDNLISNITEALVNKDQRHVLELDDSKIKSRCVRNNSHNIYHTENIHLQFF